MDNSEREKKGKPKKAIIIVAVIGFFVLFALLYFLKKNNPSGKIGNSYEENLLNTGASYSEDYIIRDVQFGN